MKEYHTFHKISGIFILAVLLFLSTQMEVQAEAVDIVSDGDGQLCAGTPLEAILDDDVHNVQYYWYIDDEIISGSEDSTYIPGEQDYEHWIKVKVLSDGELIGSSEVYFSKLPVIYIDTEDGDAITSKTNYKDANMYIQGNEEYASQYDGGIEIKGRGNTSWFYQQKPYKIKLNKSTNLFGFGKNKHWVLLSPYNDQSLMRNRIAFDLSGELGLTQMQITWVDVILNGEYAGNYSLCEHIRVAENRIPVFNWGDEIEEIAKQVCKAHGDTLREKDRDAIESLLERKMDWVTTGVFRYRGKAYTISDYYQASKDISGGYIFEMSNEYDEASKFMTSGELKVMLNTPEYLKSNNKMFNYVKGYWQQFEDGICSPDGYNTEGKHYQELADFDSMVEYWLAMEIMGNNDAYYKSRYAYKDQGKLLTFGPVWDFDHGCGSLTVGTVATDWKVSTGTLWKDFIDDPYFCVKAAEKYWSIRDYLEEIIQDGGMIDRYYEYLYESGHATEEKYPAKYYGKYRRRGYDEDVSVMKTYMKQRVAWLDKQFASNSDIVASLRLSASTNPYVRSEEQLSISLPNTVEDTMSEGIKADGILDEDILEVQVDVKDEQTTSLNVYVNGYEYSTLNVTDGKVFLDMDTAPLNAEAGTQNVISLIGKDANGNITYTNFATVIVRNAYTITFDSQGGENVRTILVRQGNVIPKLEEAERFGYTFAGWCTDSDTSKSFAESIMPAHNIKLYAKWEPEIYSVHFEVNGGEEITDVLYAYDTKLSPPEEPVREGYSFAGWYSDPELTKEYHFATMPAEDIIIYAKWEVRDYTIHFDSNGGSDVPDITQAYGTELTEPDMPSKKGYLFTGWYIDDACTLLYELDTMPAGDMTLYAGWKAEEYTVKWIDHDGKVIKEEKVPYGENGTKPPDPKRSGYAFTGWSAKAEKIDADLTIKAEYEKIIITLSGQYKKARKNKSAIVMNSTQVSSIILYTGAYRVAQLTAKVTGSGQAVKWSSSDSDIVTVSKTGKVTAQNAGTAYVTAEVGGATARCQIIVQKAELTAKLSNKKMSGNKYILKAGKKYKMKATVTPYGKITYKVKNKKILKITGTGRVTALKKGTTTITIVANGMQRRFKIKVK